MRYIYIMTLILGLFSIPALAHQHDDSSLGDMESYEESAGEEQIQSFDSEEDWPRPGMVECNARDTGWEEHWGGHSAYSWSYYQAQRRALRVCERYHGRCYVKGCHRT